MNVKRKSIHLTKTFFFIFLLFSPIYTQNLFPAAFGGSYRFNITLLTPQTNSYSVGDTPELWCQIINVGTNPLEYYTLIAEFTVIAPSGENIPAGSGENYVSIPSNGAYVFVNYDDSWTIPSDVEPGSYDLRVTISSSTYGISETETVFNVFSVDGPPNQPPSASKISPLDDTVNILPGDTLTFNVELTDVDGNLHHVDWFLDGPNTDTTMVFGSIDTDTWTHTFTESGTVVATVFDEELAHDSVSWTVITSTHSFDFVPPWEYYDSRSEEITEPSLVNKAEANAHATDISGYLHAYSLAWIGSAGALGVFNHGTRFTAPVSGEYNVEYVYIVDGKASIYGISPGPIVSLIFGPLESILIDLIGVLFTDLIEVNNAGAHSKLLITFDDEHIIHDIYSREEWIGIKTWVNEEIHETIIDSFTVNLEQDTTYYFDSTLIGWTANAEAAVQTSGSLIQLNGELVRVSITPLGEEPDPPPEPTILNFRTNPPDGAISFESSLYENGESEIIENTAYLVEAIPLNSEYKFFAWDTSENIEILNQIVNPTTIEVYGSGYIDANFEVKIEFQTDPPNIGQIAYESEEFTDGQIFWEKSVLPKYGGIIPISAIVPLGYTFVEWTTSGKISVQDYSEPLTQLFVEGPGTLTAVFIYENISPVADAGGPYSGEEGVAISFDGTWSYDPNGEIVSYVWDFGDGGTGEGPTPSHTYTAAGIYQVILTVTDDDGATDSDTTTVLVEPTPFLIDYISSDLVEYGDVLTVEGSGATAGNTVNIYWDLVGAANLLTSTTGLPDGTFDCEVDVPSAYYGNHYIWAKDLATGLTVRSDAISVVSKITLSPSSGFEGDDVLVKGYGFSEYSEITFDYNGLAEGLGNDETDELGYFEYTFEVDPTDYAKYYIMTAEDEDTHIAEATFTLERERTYEIDLFEGWNLISIPCIPEVPYIEIMLYDIIDYVESVWAYDGETGYWSSYSPGAPSDLTEMVDGKGYWIKMTTDMVWEIDIG